MPGDEKSPGPNVGPELFPVPRTPTQGGRRVVLSVGAHVRTSWLASRARPSDFAGAARATGVHARRRSATCALARGLPERVPCYRADLRRPRPATAPTAATAATARHRRELAHMQPRGCSSMRARLSQLTSRVASLAFVRWGARGSVAIEGAAFAVAAVVAAVAFWVAEEKEHGRLRAVGGGLHA